MFSLKSEVRAAKVSGNLDSPEGGLDALMQAVVCDVCPIKFKFFVLFTTGLTVSITLTGYWMALGIAQAYRLLNRCGFPLRWRWKGN
jgi:hypothetical protein